MKVEDAWDRNPDAESTDDLLFVRYDPADTTPEELLEVIRKEGFEGEVVDEQRE